MSENDDLTILGSICVSAAIVTSIGGFFIFVAVGRTWLDLGVYLLSVLIAIALAAFGFKQQKDNTSPPQT